jgi:hypothetical protein
MSRTEELREILDGLGVAWTGTECAEPSKGHPAHTSWECGEGVDATFVERTSGSVLRLFDCTARRAADAAMGRAATIRRSRE